MIFIQFSCHFYTYDFFLLVEFYFVMPTLKTLLLLLETSSVVDKKCHSLQLYYRRAPLYFDMNGMVMVLTRNSEAQTRFFSVAGVVPNCELYDNMTI